jgi:hypothetical protein
MRRLLSDLSDIPVGTIIFTVMVFAIVGLAVYVYR